MGLSEHPQQMVVVAEAIHASKVLDSPKKSPRTPVAAYVVRNTFIEVHDHHEESGEEELNQPLFRRRRGSSFFRCASEPLRIPREVGGGANGVDGGPCSVQEGDNASNPEMCNIFESQDRQLKLRRDSVDIAYLTTGADWNSSGSALQLPAFSQSPQMPPGSFKPVRREDNSALAAAMQAGFSAGVLAAMSLTGPTSAPAQRNTVPQPSRAYLSRTDQHDEFAGWSRGRQSNLGDGKGRSTTPPGRCSSNTSEASTTIGSATSQGAPSPVPKPSSSVPCHLIWCDTRAFKEASAAQRSQLEAETHLPVKAHKSAENCIRLLRKKQNAQGRPPCVILVSSTNSVALLPFLNAASHLIPKVVVLQDSNGNRKYDGADQILTKYPFVERVASSWSEAVHAIGMAVAEIQVAQW